jgi:inosine-uridine nucleoside N-ribohydrolase
MKPSLPLLLSSTLLCVSSPAAESPEALAAAVELPFDRACPVFHDNDDHRDVYTEEYLMALAHLGEIRLVGLTTTYAPSAREYDLFVKGRAEIVALARRSGLKNLPEAMPGTGGKLTRPASNKPEDTQPLRLAASRALISAARQCTPEKPLVFLTGGQLTVVADAWLQAPDIADRVVVAGLFGAPGRDYNASLDAWAWTIVMSKFRVLAVPFGDSKKRGTVFLKAAEVPKERIRAELPQSVPLVAWMLEKRHPSNPGPEEHDYDGQAAIALMRPDFITQVRRWRPAGIHLNGDVKLVPDDNGPVIEAVDAEQSVSTAEFWRAMHALRDALPKPAAAASALPAAPPGLRVSDNRRFLVTAEGKPFFWLADTAWQLIHDLNAEETRRYFADRRDKGFTVIQTVALAEVRSDLPNAQGHMPIEPKRPDRPIVKEGPDNDYWDDVDRVLRLAKEHGLHIALLPTWGKWVTSDWQNGLVNGFFTVANAEAYGRFLGERFRAQDNIVWILGGDKAAPTDESRAIWRAMARGIAIGRTGREDYSQVLMSYHTSGPGSTAWFLNNEPWMDFHALQSGHGRWAMNWMMVEHAYTMKPTLPVIDLETSYPGFRHGRPLTVATDDDARRAAWWAVFAGAAGHTYGHHSIWQMHSPKYPGLAGPKEYWYDALDAPSAAQLGHLRKLIESRAFLTQRPDLSLLAFEQTKPWEMCLALRGEGYALLYTPTGRKLDVHLDKLGFPKASASWFDPRTGATTPIAVVEKKTRHTFDPPGEEAPGNDWVLVLEKELTAVTR